MKRFSYGIIVLLGCLTFSCEKTESKRKTTQKTAIVKTSLQKINEKLIVHPGMKVADNVYFETGPNDKKCYELKKFIQKDVLRILKIRSILLGLRIGYAAQAEAPNMIFSQSNFVTLAKSNVLILLGKTPLPGSFLRDKNLGLKNGMYAISILPSCSGMIAKTPYYCFEISRLAPFPCNGKGAGTYISKELKNPELKNWKNKANKAISKMKSIRLEEKKYNHSYFLKKKPFNPFREIQKLSGKICKRGGYENFADSVFMVGKNIPNWIIANFLNGLHIDTYLVWFETLQEKLFLRTMAFECSSRKKI